MSPTATKLTRVLRERFGLRSFRPGQLAVIKRLLVGKSVAAVFPTGGGKSLCYQLPATELAHVTLVVSPLLALMREQVQALQARGIAAARLDSSLSAAEVGQTLEQVQAGNTKLLYVAPERFFNERFREFIASIPVSLFAIDEAHCISQWGHNFRPDYLKLAKVARELNPQCVLALTATATPSVLSDIRREFGIASRDVVQTAFFRSNLRLRFSLCTVRSRSELLIDRLRSQALLPSVVYVSLQRAAEEVAGRLREVGIDARAYHAGLSDDIRRETQDWFMTSERGVVVATIAFGMGVDKADIRSVYHHNPAKSLENYAQEIGRAGRDGQPAVCETLLVPEDRVILENFIYGDMPSADSLRRLIEFLKGQPEQFFMSHYAVAHEVDMRDSVLRTLLTHMELQHWLAPTIQRYDAYRFKLKKPAGEIIKGSPSERRQSVSEVLAMATKKRIWFDMQLAALSARHGQDRTHIAQTLNFLADHGWIELQARQLVSGYRKLLADWQPRRLAKKLQRYVLERQQAELLRVEQLFEFLCSSRCQAAGLSEHFGQPLLEPCGQCSACLGQSLGQLPPPDYPQVGDAALTALRRVLTDHPELLSTVEQQSRWLCGMTSPKLMRARLTQHPLYGCCAAIPLPHVLHTLQQVSAGPEHKSAK